MTEIDSKVCSGTELAWAAGFFDGEGWVTKNNGKPKPTLSIGVGQSGDPQALHRFQKAVGIGTVGGPYKPGSPNRKVRYQYHATGHKARNVIEQLRPYLLPIKLEKYDRLKKEVVFK